MKINIRNARVVTSHNDSVTIEVPFEPAYLTGLELARIRDSHGTERDMTALEQRTFEDCLDDFQRRMLGHALAETCGIVHEM